METQKAIELLKHVITELLSNVHIEKVQSKYDIAYDYVLVTTSDYEVYVYVDGGLWYIIYIPSKNIAIYLTPIVVDELTQKFNFNALELIDKLVAAISDTLVKLINT